MKRTIIHIDAEACTGCGLCTSACHENAIGMVNGKAKLLREDFCDGLGDCLPTCPVGAITFEERDAPAYDHAAKGELPCGCPASRSHAIEPVSETELNGEPATSMLRQWPVQIKLVPVRALWLDGADLLLAADCTAYAYGAFHRDFIQGHVVLVGCPKLDQGDYAEKLTALLRENTVKTVTVARMEVPCCGGLQRAAEAAVAAAGRPIPLYVSVITVDGQVI